MSLFATYKFIKQLLTTHKKNSGVKLSKIWPCELFISHDLKIVWRQLIDPEKNRVKNI